MKQIPKAQKHYYRIASSENKMTVFHKCWICVENICILGILPMSFHTCMSILRQYFHSVNNPTSKQYFTPIFIHSTVNI